jgi:hypothetical protein
MKLKLFLSLFSILFFVNSCDVLQQIEGMKSFSKCEFRIYTISDMQLAGIDVSGIQSVSDVKPMDMLQLTNGYLNNNLPLNFNLNLQVKNPNDQAASLNRLEWLLFIDGEQLLEGVVNETFVTGPGQTGILPVQIGFNLADAIKSKNLERIVDYATGLTDGSGKTTRVMLRLKPSVTVGQQNIMYPGWIEVRNEFTAI